jgi:hypothetical protein
MKENLKRYVEEKETFSSLHQHVQDVLKKNAYNSLSLNSLFSVFA